MSGSYFGSSLLCLSSSISQLASLEQLGVLHDGVNCENASVRKLDQLSISCLNAFFKRDDMLETCYYIALL